MRKLLVATILSLVFFSFACGRADNTNRAGNASASATRDDKETGASDAWITAEVKLRLLADNRVSGFATDVDTKDGVVTLSGKVDVNENRAAAEEVAKKVDGVKSVNNQIQVVPDAKRAEVNATDDKIEVAIGKALETDPVLKDLSLAADSNNGVVTVDGTVDNQDQLLKYAQAIRKVPGVKSVVTTPVTVKTKS